MEFSTCVLVFTPQYQRGEGIGGDSTPVPHAIRYIMVQLVNKMLEATLKCFPIG